MLKEKTTNVIRKTLKIHHMIFHVCNTNSSHFSLVLRSLSESLTEGLGVSILSFVQLLLGKKDDNGRHVQFTFSSIFIVNLRGVIAFFLKTIPTIKRNCHNCFFFLQNFVFIKINHQYSLIKLLIQMQPCQLKNDLLALIRYMKKLLSSD